jgi:hypothetical protein
MCEGPWVVNASGGAEASLNGLILVAKRLPDAAETEILTFGNDDVVQEVTSVQCLHEEDPYQEVGQRLLDR